MAKEKKAPEAQKIEGLQKTTSTRRHRRASDEIVIAVIEKHFGTTEAFKKNETVLRNALSAMQAEKKSKKKDFNRLLKGKTVEELQAMVEAIQARIDGGK